MKATPKDLFARKAREYDKEATRTNNVSNIANFMIKEIKFSKDMHLMDFGSGTGLLLSKIAPYVNQITAVDISKSMTEVLHNKRQDIDCHLEILEVDLTKAHINQKFDGIISSMTIHHIKDTLNIFKTFYEQLKTNGIIAIADLDKEDGTFHSVDTGVFHHGFDREEFLNMAKSVGFKNLKIQTVGFAEKPYGKYPIFLLTGTK